MRYPSYPAYKDSGVAWLGDVPLHWERKRLRFVATMNPSKQEASQHEKDSLVSFLPMEAVGNDGTLKLDTTRPIAEVENGYTYFAEGDVTLAKITPCFENGKGAIMRGLVNGIGFGTTELAVIRPNADTDVRYLYYLTMSQSFRKRGEAVMYGAGGQKRVPDSFIRNFDFAWPSHSEQAAIAAFLDRETAKIAALIAKQERLIALLGEKRQALIAHAVTKGLRADAPMQDSGVAWLGEIPAHWEVKRLKDSVAAMKNGVWGDEPKQDDNDFICVRVADFDRTRFSVNLTQPTMRNITSSEQKGRVLEKGNLLLEKSGGGEHQPVGVIVAYDHDGPAVCSNFVARVVPAKGTSVRYFLYLHASFYSKRINVRSIKQTSGIQNLDAGSYLAEYATFPPLDEQYAIAAFLDGESAKFEELIAKAQQAIALMREHRMSLIAAAVTGKIDVRGVMAEAGAEVGDARLAGVAR